MEQRTPTEIFIEKARKIHGDRYDYSITVYHSRHAKVKYICPKHGIIEQEAGSHLSGRGCEKCSYEYRGIKRRISDFVKRAKEVHGDKYDYSKVNYINGHTKVIIICPIHGEFEQEPLAHLQGRGCFKCGRDITGLKKRKNQENFINQAKQIHGDKYLYDRVEYINSTTPVEIICKKHGAFNILPMNLLSGKGCMKCRNEKISKRVRMKESEFVKRSNEVHNGKYDYCKVIYEGKDKKVTIICPIHGEFRQLAGHHIKGVGCPQCLHSKGEDKISNYLNTNGILFIPQYVISNDNLFCNRKTIRVDFYLPYNKTIIEFNGRQHYEPIRYFGGESKFESQQNRDDALRQYCNEREIKLVEIPYNDINNIEAILDKYFKFKKR